MPDSGRSWRIPTLPGIFWNCIFLRSTGSCASLSTLKLEPATFVEPDLHQYASDILWSVKTTGGEDGYVYTLIEHQSTENLYMPFRMLRYSVAAMQDVWDKSKTSTGDSGAVLSR